MSAFLLTCPRVVEVIVVVIEKVVFVGEELRVVREMLIITKTLSKSPSTRRCCEN